MKMTQNTYKQNAYEKTEKLIKCVKQYPFLYDMKHDGYKNVGMKNRVWEQIGLELKETSDVVRTKWKSLRDNYGRYKKEMADPTIQVRKFVRWPWGEQLRFLDAGEEDREKTAEDEAPQDVPQLLHFLEISLNEQEAEGSSRDSNEPEVKDESPAQTPQPAVEDGPRPKRLKRADTPEKSFDSVDHLFKSYAQTFRTFTKKNQIALKVLLAQLFADMEAKHVNETESN